MKYVEIGHKIWEYVNESAEANAKRLVIMASMHGDEPAGLAAIEFIKNWNLEVSKDIHSIKLIIGNPIALERNVRAVDIDLNRLWNEQENHDTNTVEYRRYLELRPFLFQPNTVLLDLHTTSAEHYPFVIVDHISDKLARAMIYHFPVRFISYNWSNFIGKKTATGGLFEYDPGAMAFTYELGQHLSSEAEEQGVQAVRAFINFYNTAHIPEERENSQVWLKVIQQFSLPEMEWKWHKVERGPFKISTGELLGYVDGIEYRAPVDGYLVMPNQKISKVNTDIGFFAVEGEKE